MLIVVNLRLVLLRLGVNMKLMGVEYGRLWSASGARGFFDDPDEYRYHTVSRLLGLDYRWITFVAKTMTTHGRVGNMKLDESWRPKSFYPDCIRVKFVKGVVLNAVGLSGPSAESLLATGKYAGIPCPFAFSYMPTGSTTDELVRDASEFGDVLRAHRFWSPFALEVNVSCPNVDHVTDWKSIVAVLSALREKLPRTPLIPKFNALEPIETAVRIASSRYCDAVLVGNTIPWGRRPDVIDWVNLFGSETSPLAKYGGGGLSGRPLLPLTLEWVSSAVGKVDKPIMAGGGIMSVDDVVAISSAGAAAMELGVVGLLRPWAVARIRNKLMIDEMRYKE